VRVYTGEEFLRAFKRKFIMDYVTAVVTALLMFISPCVLPLLPMYVTYFAAGKSNPLRTLFNALAFCVGIAIVFLVIFTAFSFASFYLTVQITRYQTEIFAVCGTLLVLFGLKFMGYLHLPFLERGISVKTKTENLGLFNAFVLGLIFSLSMGACGIGYLSTALLPVFNAANFFVLKGIFIGLIFTATLSVLFIAFAMLMDLLRFVLSFITRNYGIINYASGGLLVIVGFLVAMGFTQKITSWANMQQYINFVWLGLAIFVAFSLLLSIPAYKSGAEGGNRRASVIMIAVGAGIVTFTLIPGLFHLLGTAVYGRRERRKVRAALQADSSDVTTAPENPDAAVPVDDPDVALSRCNADVRKPDNK